MSVATAGELVALILALVSELEARGRSILGWAVVVLCLGLLWGVLH